MKNSEIAIEIEHLTKSFRIPHERRNSLREQFIHFFGQVQYEKFVPLQDISCSIRQGEFVGIIGKNGSGKSTLLKLLAGIYTPDKGRIRVEGRVAAFLELGIGFHPDLTARENVYLNGILLGMSKKTIRKKFNEIIEYAGVERFVDQKLKNFSSGMQVRLAFAVAIQSEFDILLLDEVLAVGDLDFQQKSAAYFADIKQHKDKTVILVTHDLAAVKKYCTSIYLLEDSHLIGGEKADILERYHLPS